MWLSAKEPKRKDIKHPISPMLASTVPLCYLLILLSSLSFFHNNFFSLLIPFISSKAGPNTFEAATSGVAPFVKIQSAFRACFLPPPPSPSVAARRGNIEQRKVPTQGEGECQINKEGDEGGRPHSSAD